MTNYEKFKNYIPNINNAMNNFGNTVDNFGHTIGNTMGNFGNTIGNTVGNFGNTMGNYGNMMNNAAANMYDVGMEKYNTFADIQGVKYKGFPIFVIITLLFTDAVLFYLSSMVYYKSKYWALLIWPVILFVFGLIFVFSFKSNCSGSLGNNSNKHYSLVLTISCGMIFISIAGFLIHYNVIKDWYPEIQL